MKLTLNDLILNKDYLLCYYERTIQMEIKKWLF